MPLYTYEPDPRLNQARQQLNRNTLVGGLSFPTSTGFVFFDFYDNLLKAQLPGSAPIRTIYHPQPYIVKTLWDWRGQNDF